MWRYPFFNLCFVILVITFVSIQHSAAVFGPTVHGWLDTSDQSERRYFFTLFGESPRSLRVPAEFSRAAAFLNDTWRREEYFHEWLMEYNSSQWEIFRASSPAETDLLEARFHVANAEVFTEAMSETNRAIKELDRAATSLQEVQALVKPTFAPQLTTISAQITAVEMNEQKGGAFSAAPFETIKADLDHLIEVLRLS
jgi:hypothetical protein